MPEQRSGDMVDAGPHVRCMHLCFALPCVLKSSVELKEAVGPIVTSSKAVEDLRRGPNEACKLRGTDHASSARTLGMLLFPPAYVIVNRLIL